MSNGIAAEQIQSFVNRVLRLKDEEDVLKSDIRDIYAEAKSMGFDKTALGAVVAHVRKKAKDTSGFAEKAEIFDLYLSAYEGPLAYAHAHEGD